MQHGIPAIVFGYVDSQTPLSLNKYYNIQSILIVSRGNDIHSYHEAQLQSGPARPSPGRSPTH